MIHLLKNCLFSPPMMSQFLTTAAPLFCTWYKLSSAQKKNFKVLSKLQFSLFFLQDGQVQMMLKTCSADSDESFTRDTIEENATAWETTLWDSIIKITHWNKPQFNWIWFKMQLFRIFEVNIWILCAKIKISKHHELLSD